jgi:Domain of unknown function (DUF1707)/Cell wall-active antibiotics response 4TMS YvqF
MNGQMRASDADRDKVAEVLHTAYADGRISYDEHSERTAAALTARTFDDLAALTADLVPAQPTSAALVAVPDRTEPERVTAMLAETKRTGPWLAPRTINVSVLLGSAVVDLTEATFASRQVVINCTQFMGSTIVRVLPGTGVRVEAANVLGDSSVKEIGEPSDAQPTVVVRGTNILGDISVRGPKRPPIWKRNVA